MQDFVRRRYPLRSTGQAVRDRTVLEIKNAENTGLWCRAMTDRTEQIASTIANSLNLSHYLKIIEQRRQCGDCRDDQPPVRGSRGDC